jgi:hypothetical protein
MGHPKREAQVALIRDRLEAQGARPLLSMDVDSRGVWWNARKAWRMGDRSADYQMVVQDDISFCSDFVQAAEWCISLRRKEVVSFFLPRKSAVQAQEEGKFWVSTGRFLWAQAVAMPTQLSEEWLTWCEAHEDEAASFKWTCDDDRLGSFLKHKQRRVYVPVPTLVEHEGAEASLLGNPNSARRRSRGYVGDAARGLLLPFFKLDAVVE